MKKYNGWELYDIPFETSDKEFTQIRFVSQYAPMAIMFADVISTYNSLENVVDEFSDKRPQRHNIIFEDGWPNNTWYATERLRNNNQSSSNSFSGNITGNNGIDLDEICESVINEVTDNIQDAIANSINMEEIVDEIKAQIFKGSFNINNPTSL